MNKLKKWKPRPRPKKIKMEGRFCRLEPLRPKKHGDQLFKACTMDDAKNRFKWLPEYPPKNRKEFGEWLVTAQKSKDPMYFAVIDKRSGAVEGRQTLMRIDEKNGVAEIGHIYWGGRISKTPVATEAFFLFAQYIFDELGYRRFEWKCNDKNIPSKRAAERFGMSYEGTFRQAAVTKGQNRDTAWFSILDTEWKNMKQKFTQWLSPNNFYEDGKQKNKLQKMRRKK